MSRIKCFWIEPTQRVARYLRCYISQSVCSECEGQYHNVMVRIEDDDAVTETRHGHVSTRPARGTEPPDDWRWPQHCLCGVPFGAANRQLFYDRIYFNPETGEEWPLRDVPVGAVWDAFWNHDWPMVCGPDGMSLNVRTPGGDWCIDGRANNCTMPEDNVHKCWIRHGSPKDGTLHVDKNGHTCAAGAGSIAMPHYHGFLHNGYLVDC